ncbi:MAG: hypothetical protein H9535_14260 [Ignavibacteria bacterium]|nr:hypothetical protein [Ignavibacteria bacterium]
MTMTLEPVEAVCDAVQILDNKTLLLNQTMTEIKEQIRAANVQTLEQLLVKLASKRPKQQAPCVICRG